jgi:HEPN domain-containing protein
MQRQDLIEYWQVSARRDYETMQHLVASADYPWALFLGHLVIEKLLKALYVKIVDINPPKTHDLLRLSHQVGLHLREEQEDYLDLLSGFNINTRYPDYSGDFYEQCTQEFAEPYLKFVKEFQAWLIQEISK